MSDGLELLGGKEQIPEVLKFYNDTVTVIYDDKLHAYYRVEGDLKLLIPGVTSAVGIIDKSAPLMQWAANLCCEYIKEFTPYTKMKVAGVVSDYTERSYLEQLFTQARFNYRKVQKTATDIGTLAHEWLEDCVKAQINKASYAAPLPTDEKAANCVKSALDWMEKHKFTPIYSERKIFSLEYDYSGTLDWVAWITGCGDPACCNFTGTKKALGDFKSSKAIYEEYIIQITAYLKAIEEEFPQEPPVELRVILKLGKEDGLFESKVIPRDSLEDDYACFLGALAVYNWQKQNALNSKFDKGMAKYVKKLTPKPVKVKVKELPVAA